MDLSILIVNWNTCDDLLRCLRSVYGHPPRAEFEVLVLDNASSDGSAGAVSAQFPQAALVASQDNLGFARANNRLAAEAGGRYWLLLNPDTAVSPGAIDLLVNDLERLPHVAAAGPRLVNPDGSLQPSIQRLPTLLREWWRLFHLDSLYALSQYPPTALTSRQTRPVEVLNGACLLLRRGAVEPLGLFDEDYFMYSEEVDLCDRLAQAGWELHWVPEAVVMHAGGQSTRQAADRMFLELYRNKLRFFRKRRGALAGTLYKGILLQATLVRLMLTAAGRPFGARAGRRNAVARQYRLLLAELPRM